MKTDNQFASKLTRLLLKSHITYQEFVRDYPESKIGSDVFHLFDLIEHEPSTKGIFGISYKKHKQYMSEVYNLIYKLDPVPDKIGGAKTILFVDIDNRHIIKCNTKNIVRGLQVKEISCLAICKYDNESGYYLFGCDIDWNSITDTLHDNIEEAKEQAEFQFQNTEDTWILK